MAEPIDEVVVTKEGLTEIVKEGGGRPKVVPPPPPIRQIKPTPTPGTETVTPKDQKDPNG